MQSRVIRMAVIPFLLLLGISWTKLHPAVGGETKPGVSRLHGSARLASLEGFIMFIDPNLRYIVLKEKQIDVGPYLKDSRVLHTRMKSASGRDAGLESFETGQWVIVTGFEVSQARLHAVSVQVVEGSLGKRLQRLERLRLPR